MVSEVTSSPIHQRSEKLELSTKDCVNYVNHNVCREQVVTTGDNQ